MCHAPQERATTTGMTTTGMLLTHPHRLSGLSLLLLPWLAACTESAPSETARRALERERLALAIEDPKLIEVAHIEAAGADRVSPEDSGLALRLLPGDRVNGGSRCEISIDPAHEPGDTLVYRWRFLLPADFTRDAPQDHWIILAQWHDQPNRHRGETWGQFPARSPPMLLCYGRLAGKDMLAIEYGPGRTQKAGPWPVERGRWIDVSVRVRWSQGVTGSAEFTLGQGERTWTPHFEGPNMHNAYRHYFKVGIYRSPEITGPMRIIVDAITIHHVSEPAPQQPVAKVFACLCAARRQACLCAARRQVGPRSSEKSPRKEAEVGDTPVYRRCRPTPRGDFAAD